MQEQPRKFTPPSVKALARPPHYSDSTGITFALLSLLTHHKTHNSTTCATAVIQGSKAPNSKFRWLGHPLSGIICMSFSTLKSPQAQTHSKNHQSRSLAQQSQYTELSCFHRCLCTVKLWYVLHNPKTKTKPIVVTHKRTSLRSRHRGRCLDFWV